MDDKDLARRAEGLREAVDAALAWYLSEHPKALASQIPALLLTGWLSGVHDRLERA